MRRQTNTRQQKTTVLLATNGERTEEQYLKRLKGVIEQTHPKKYSITVIFKDGNPVTLLGKLKSPQGDASVYDQVWLFIDKDDNTLSLDRFLVDCRREDKNRERENTRSRKRGKIGPGQERVFKAVVSNPCFEVWLVAYFARVKRYQNQDEAQHHYERLAGLPRHTKNLPESITTDSFDTQCDNAKLVGADHIELNAEGVPPGTAIPNFLKFYGLV